MALKYSALYHPLTLKNDIPKIDKRWRGEVKNAIETKLTTQPDLFGAPLRQTLKGYRKLRVGDYRVIYRIEKETVKVIIIAHRRDAYEKVYGRK